MSRKAFSCLLVLILGLLSFGVVAAQSTTPEPTPQGELGLGDVVGNKTQYYGQSVTVEGTIEEVINVRAFVVGDGATLNDHQLLVIDNSDQPFDIGVRKDQKVRLTGILCPSFNDGGWTQLVGPNSVNGPSPTEQANATQAVGNTTSTSNMAGCSANGMAGNMSGANTTASSTMEAGNNSAAGAAATAQTTPMMNATMQVTPGMAATQQMTSGAGGFDLSQMYIRNDLKSFTLLVLPELHITYLPS